MLLAIAGNAVVNPSQRSLWQPPPTPDPSPPRASRAGGGEKNIRRLRLHPRGNFFGKEFEEKIGHWLYSPPPACGGEGSGVGGLSAVIAVSIAERTPGMFSKTSLFQNRSTR